MDDQRANNVTPLQVMAQQRHGFYVERLIEQLDRGDLDPADPDLAAALARLGVALGSWQERHLHEDPPP